MDRLRTILKPALLASLLGLPFGCLSATLQVNGAAGCDDDDGNPYYCHIQRAIDVANPLDTINVAAGTYTERLTIDRSVELRGVGAATTVIDAYGGQNIRVVLRAAAILRDLTIRNGNAGPTGLGGGILVDIGTHLTVYDTVISGNTAGYGAGLCAGGTVTLFRTRITGNTADAGAALSYGGGLYIIDSGSVTLTNSLIDANVADIGGGIFNLHSVTLGSTTVSGNIANNDGAALYNGSGSAATAMLTNATVTGNASAATHGGLYNGFGTISLNQSIIAGNTAVGGDQDCATAPGQSFVTMGYNYIGSLNDCTITGGTGDQFDAGYANLHLGPLADNGGPTPTHALLAGSPAIDAGNPAFFPATDQRGMALPIDGDSDGTALCDIGAFEAAEGTNDGGTDGDGDTDGDPAGGGSGGGVIDLAGLALLAAGIGARRRPAHP